MKKIYLTFLFAFSLSAFCKAQWVSLGTGISPATTHDVWSISVVDENVVWAVTFNNATFVPTKEFTRTSNGGASWSTGFVDFPDDGQDFNHIFAVDSLTAWVSVTKYNGLITGSIYHTEDGGLTWVHQNTAYAESGTGPQAVHFYDADNGFTFGCPPSGKFRGYTTSDGGDTWEPASIPAALPSEKVEYNTGNGMYTVAGDKVWFVTGQARVFKSDDRGHNWYVVGNAFSPVPPLNSGPNSIAFKDSLNGIVVSYWHPEAARTTDGGVTWEPLSNFPNKNVVQVEYIPGTKGAYLAHSGWGFNLGTNILKTCDDGDNWEVFTANQNVNTLEFLSQSVGYGGDIFSNATQGGMFKWDSDLLMDCEIISKTQEPSALPLTISPNPTSDFLNIQLPEPANIPLDVYLFDARGRLLGKQKLANGQSLHLQGLTPGVYLLKAVAGERVFSAKFVKQ